MSVKVMSWVWDHSQAQGADRFVLIAIADSADHDGTNAWPSNATLCRKTGMSERTIRRCIANLVALGELEVRYNAGPHGTNRYTLPMHDHLTPAILTPGQSDPPVNVAPLPGQADPTPPVTVTPEPSLTHPDPSIGAPTALPKAGKSKKGERIPDVFVVTDDMWSWAETKCPLIDADLETVKFVNFWKAKPGKDATKLDWERTWQNWLIKAQQDEARRNRPRTNSTMASRSSPRR